MVRERIEFGKKIISKPMYSKPVEKKTKFFELEMEIKNDKTGESQAAIKKQVQMDILTQILKRINELEHEVNRDLKKAKGQKNAVDESDVRSQNSR